MKYLFVVAHPDDEVLGAGATIKKLSSAENEVAVCIMSSKAQARTMRPQDEGLNVDMQKALKSLGVNHYYMGDFPNIEMNTVPHLKLVQFIEKSIMDFSPDVVITHHPSDTNNDHLQTSLACQAAIRIFQRNTQIRPLREFWYMEVLSSSDWSVNTALKAFAPNVFIEIGETGVKKKVETLKLYRGVMRPYPHPRSEETIKGLAAYRGSQSGCDYAEAFECVLRRI